MALMALPLSLCSKDNDDPKQDFEPVTISLEDVNIGTTDTSFSVDGFNFKSEGSETTPENYVDGIGIWPGTIELDLSSLNNISKISIELHNNSDPEISVLNNGIVVKDFISDIEGGPTTVQLDVGGLTIDALKIFSYEAIIISIKLE